MINNLFKFFASFSKWEKTIFLYIVCGGLLFLFLVPPFQKPDEPAHYIRTIALSTGQLYCGPKGFQIQKSDAGIINDLETQTVAYKYSSKFPIGLLKAALFKTGIDKQTINNKDWCGLVFVGYIPNLMGILAGKLLGFPVITFYLSRLSGFLFFLITLVLSIYLLRSSKYKWVLYFYASIPMVLHQVTAISYDVLQFSLAPLIFSYLVNVLENKIVGGKWYLHS